MFEIIPFEPRYRDDLLFCLLLAKDALGKIPSLNEDLLDVERNYLGRGDMFWVALEGGRVVGMVGTHTESETDLWLKRLYVKPDMKRRGLGRALVETAEAFARGRGIAAIHTRFSDDYAEAAGFYPKMGFADAGRSGGNRHMVKEIKQNGEKRQ